MVPPRNDPEPRRHSRRSGKEAMMASSHEREVEEPAAAPIDFRNLLLGAWPDGGEDEPAAAAEPSSGTDAADDPQWITWSDTSAETAWAAIEIALTLGASPPRAR
jgi:hypothetical protein